MWPIDAESENPATATPARDAVLFFVAPLTPVRREPLARLLARRLPAVFAAVLVAVLRVAGAFFRRAAEARFFVV